MSKYSAQKGFDNVREPLCGGVTPPSCCYVGLGGHPPQPGFFWCCCVQGGGAPPPAITKAYCCCGGGTSPSLSGKRCCGAGLAGNICVFARMSCCCCGGGTPPIPRICCCCGGGTPPRAVTSYCCYVGGGDLYVFFKQGLPYIPQTSNKNLKIVSHIISQTKVSNINPQKNVSHINPNISY